MPNTNRSWGMQRFPVLATILMLCVGIAVLPGNRLLLAQDPGATTLGETTRDGRLAPLLNNLGNLRYPISTKSKEAQTFFNQGLTLVYAFNHAEALRSFREAARLDPECAMAYWGQALALAPNINDPAIGADREKQGQEAIAAARQRASRAKEKERKLIDALAARFATTPGADRDPLNQAYAEAMAGVYKQFPRDIDIAVLYADAVMNTMPWSYWDKQGEPKPGTQQARAALESALKRSPNHPGAHHLYIHLLEASDHVDRAVPSADKLGGLVPAAGHLVHMPAHIYIRVGRYSDAAESNIRAIAADEDYITQCRVQGIYPAAYYPHNIHFLSAALIMDGRGVEAINAARKVAAHHDHGAMHEPGFAFPHLLKTMPYMALVRFGRWEEMLDEPEPPADHVFGRAVWHFARGFALTAQNKPKEAQVELESMKRYASEPGLADLKIFELNSLSTLASIGVAMLEGELARAAARYDESIAAFQRAVQHEDDLLYSEPPDWLLPPRQFLAQALLEAGRAAEAEKEYREDLRRHRDNGWSLRGLEESLRKQGKNAEADQVRASFNRAWTRSDVQLAGSRF